MTARKNIAHDIVVESLAEALLQLMEKKPFSDISISELCTRAGVGRVSFYRNYDNMQDILSDYLTKCTDEWWAEFIQHPQEYFRDHFWSELLEQYRKNERLISLIYQNDLSYIIKNHIFSCCGPKPEHDEKTALLCAMLAGMIYGLVDEWIRRGMPELNNIFDIQKLIQYINQEGLILL